MSLPAHLVKSGETTRQHHGTTARQGGPSSAKDGSGQSGDALGQGSPGQSGDASGQDGPGQSGDASGQDSPGQSGGASGQGSGQSQDTLRRGSDHGSSGQSGPGQSGTVVTEGTDSNAIPTDTRTHSRSHSTSDYFVTPTSSPRLTPPTSPRPHMPPSPRPARIGDRVASSSANSGRHHETFFSSLPAKFEDLELQSGEHIPTQQFLLCCQAVLPFFGEC